MPSGKILGAPDCFVDVLPGTFDGNADRRGRQHGGASHRKGRGAGWIVTRGRAPLGVKHASEPCPRPAGMPKLPRAMGISQPHNLRRPPIEQLPPVAWGACEPAGGRPFRSSSGRSGTEFTGIRRRKSGMPPWRRWLAGTSTREPATSRLSCSRRWRSSPRSRAALRSLEKSIFSRTTLHGRRLARRDSAGLRITSERSTEEQVERLSSALFESRRQVHRADGGIEPQEHTRVLARVAEARIARRRHTFPASSDTPR